MVASFVGRVLHVILRGAGYAYLAQPRKLQLFWGSALGGLLARLRFRSSVVQQNLGFAYPNETSTQKKLARASYNQLGNLVLEIILLFGPMRTFILKYVTLEGLENWKYAKSLGKGVVFLSSHLGNWEIMAAAGGMLGKMDLMLVTKHLKPEWVHRAIEEGRKKCGVSATYEPKTLRDILSHLKKNGTVGFVLDQYSGPPVGVRVPFFDVPVSTSMAMATLVRRTGACVLPVENFRKADGRWTVRIHSPLTWIENSDQHYELAVNTAHYVSILEASIRAHPEQWLWTHRRFKGDLSPLKQEEWNEPRVRR